MPERFDVVVVGARCAGSALAIDLAGAGLHVAVVDRATFPSDTISGHYIFASGISALDRFGVLNDLSTCGAPFVNLVDWRIDDLAGVEPFGTDAAGGQAGVCIRRPVLDTALVTAAGKAGATVSTGTRVTGLVRTHDRVTGVTVVDKAGQERQLDATLVVGADGMGSTVARLVGARRYHVHPNDRFAYFGYYEGVAADPPACSLHRFGEELTFGFPCDAGLYVFTILAPHDRLPAFADDLDGAFDATIRLDEAFAGPFAEARRVGPLRGMVRFPRFFRESAGPGWVLVGDAGHFKDPCVGQGIADAFRQAGVLAEAIISSLATDVDRLDEATTAWWAWRDAEELDMHWMAVDLAAAGPVPVILKEVFRELADSPGGLQPFWDTFQHRLKPSEVLIPERFGAAADRLAGTPAGEQAKAELTAISELAEQRQLLAQRPCFESERGARRDE